MAADETLEISFKFFSSVTQDGATVSVPYAKTASITLKAMALSSVTCTVTDPAAVTHDHDFALDA